MSALDRIFEAAAEARSHGVRQRTDRPSDRRCSEAAGAPAVAVTRSAKLQLRDASAGSGLLHFQGCASAYGIGYEMWDCWGPYTESVSPGAGKQSLANPDLDVPLVLAHDSLRRIARTTNGTLTLTEPADGSGLFVDAPSLDPNDGDVAYIAPKLIAELVDEMSFKFVITMGSWSPDWMEYHIDAYDVHRGDVAIVGYGANPYTAGSGLRSLELPKLEDLTESALRTLENDLHTERQRRGIDQPASSMSFAELDLLDRSMLIAPRV